MQLLMFSSEEPPASHSASQDSARVRAPAGIPRRLHRHPLAQKDCRSVSRRAAIQGAREFDGGASYAVDWRAHCDD